MDYNVIEGKEYNIHLIKNKKFHTIDIRVFFTENVSKEKITYRNFLSSILTSETMKYQSRQELIKKCQDLYSLYPVGSSYRSGNYLTTKFGLSIISSKYIDENILIDNLLLLKEILLNPFVKDNEFDKKYFEIVREELKAETKSIDEEPRILANLSLLKLLDDNKNQLLSGYSDLELLSKINPKNLYDSYLEMLTNSKIDIFISGNFSNSKNIIKVINDNFVFNNRKEKLVNPIIIHNEKRENVNVLEITKDYQQSKLSLGYKLYDLNYDENRYISFVFCTLLGGGASSLLMREVREENSLCYYINSIVMRFDNTLVITSGINKDNYQKVVDLVNKSLHNISLGKFSLADLSKAKMENIVELSSILENNRNIINYYYGMSIFKSEELEKKIQKIKSVSKKDIMDFVKKIHLDSIFFMEGNL